MYKREYDALLEKRCIPKSVLFYGECDYLVSLYAKKSAAIVGSSDEIKRFYFSEFDIAHTRELLGTSSLFGDKNIIIAKLDKKLKKEEITSLLEAAAKNDESYLFIEFYGESIDAKSMAAYFTKERKSDSVRFFEPLHAEAIEIIEQKAKNISLEITHAELSEIYKIHDGNLGLAINELEKLSVGLKSGVSLGELVSGLSAKKSDELFFELLEKKDVRRDFLSLLQEGAQEVELIGGLLNFLHRITLFRLYAKAYGAPNVQEIFGYTPPKQVIERISMLAFRLKEKELRDIISILFETQLKLKSDSGASKEAIFLSSLIRVQASLL